MAVSIPPSLLLDLPRVFIESVQPVSPLLQAVQQAIRRTTSWAACAFTSVFGRCSALCRGTADVDVPNCAAMFRNEPLWAVVTIWSAVVRRNFVIPIGTNGPRPNTDRNLRRSVIAGSYKKTGGNNQETQMSQGFH